uniref:PH-like domain-containing protein n=1 Tax=Neobodo designis TaxID=312471 RepID=A0A7S1PU71_NEODS|mmetsp:Transcript_204/g.800  ORF Transcript_204/g.800 Transcript_204/m.800 type:complete len:452 (+) Transcript_204:20-1375(+)
MASPGVTFNLRGVVGGRSADADGASDDETPRAGTRLGDFVRGAAKTTSTREEEERAAARGRSGLFRYSSAASPPPPTAALGEARLGSPTPSSYAAPVDGPTAEDVRRRFEAMASEEDRGDANGHRAAQVVTNDDGIIRTAPRALDFGRSRSRSNSPGFRYGGPLRDHARPPQAAPPPRAPDEYGDIVSSNGYDDPSDGSRGAGRGFVRGSDTEEDMESYPPPGDDEPVVPPELLRGEDRPSQWEDHPAHQVVMSLLEKRGVIPSQFPELVQYHMAAVFLDFLLVVMNGAYFVKYGHKGTAPKERFVRLRILNDEVGRLVPYITITIHRDGVQIIDRARLEDLVGITRGVDGAAFRRHLIHYDVIKGSYVGQHRAHVSTKGAFSLWFYDRKTRRPKSLDLLTTNLNVFEVWTRAMEGILSVNSVCIHRTNVAQEMQRLFRLAQQVLDEELEE